MSDESVPVSVLILDKEYMVSCPPDERDALIESARELNERMRRLRDGGKVLGSERMAVMTALNLIHECTRLRRERDDLARSLAGDIRRIEDKVAGAIGRRRPVETVD